MSERTAERPAPVDRLRNELDALDRAYSPGHHGRWSAARRAELVDACVRALFEAAEPPGRVTLVALGGYGRRELAPASDIDLLIVHDGSATEAMSELAERLLYPLWDAGLSVGHAVRTPDECLELAAERLDAATAMLDGRALAGEPDGWTQVRSALVSALGSDPRGFARRLRDDAERRRERFGSASGLLEPELKEGGGGLRDVAALTWLGEIVGERDGSDLGLVRAGERRAVHDAHEFLVRVRSALHLDTGRRTDRLLLEHQPVIAAQMGFVDEPGLLAVDGLMRQVFEHARQVEHVSSSAFDRYLRGASEVELEPGPEGVLRAFATVALERGVIPPDLLDRVEQVPLDEEIAWTPAIRDTFLEVLRQGADGVRVLEAMDRIGLLERFLPAWADVRCRPQRDPYHRHTVDVHLLHTLAVTARLLEDPGDDPLAARAAEAISDQDAVRLGALLHDIGKTGASGHARSGTAIAERTLDRMGLPAPTRDLALFMVAEHLLLPDTATRRDLQDEELIHDVATRVGDPERLAALYLLAVADAEATGPLAWTPWRATLVRELVAKAQRILERGEVGARTAERLAERAEAIRAALVAEEPQAVDRFILRMPRGYVLGVAPERVAKHYPLLSSPVGSTEVRTLSGPGHRPATHELTVVAADRPGLLSMIAGALTLAGLSILSAQVFTTEDGVAVDVFEVEGAFEPEVGEERWRRFRGSLRKAIEGRMSLAHGVREKRRHYPEPRGDIPVRVSVDNDASDFFTVIEVGAADRIGLLFDVTRTLAELGLDVHLAKVATYGEHVVDAFYVRDALGRKVEEADLVAELERFLRERIGS
jgi:[protein-PII] uridylyltransferase